MPNKSKEEVVQEFRVQSIQDAAMRVIARKGMEATTMQDIAEEAGVAKGTIYLYFRDRDELVDKTFENAIGQLTERIGEALDRGTTVEEKIRGSMNAKFEYFRDHREFFRLYASLRMPEGNSPAAQRKRHCAARYSDTVNRFVGDLAAGMDRGEIRRCDPRRLALFIIEGSNAIVIERVMEENPRPLQEDVDLVLSIALDGVRSRN